MKPTILSCSFILFSFSCLAQEVSPERAQGKIIGYVLVAIGLVIAVLYERRRKKKVKDQE